MVLGLVLCVLNTLAIIFVFCYFGEQANENMGNIAECLWNDMDWQKLPVHLQKYLILMVANMQKPHFYHGYIVNLDLNRFLRVSDQIKI